MLNFVGDLIKNSRVKIPATSSKYLVEISRLNVRQYVSYPTHSNYVQDKNNERIVPSQILSNELF